MGRIREDEAAVVLTFYDTGGDVQEVECVVDTGFTGYLAPARNVVQGLHLPQADEEEVSLADGSTTILALYQVDVEWLDGPRTVMAYAINGRSLVGMKMLRGCLITFDAGPDRNIVIEAD